MGIVMDGVGRVRDLPITAIDDTSTNSDLFIVFAESGNNKDLKISSSGIKFNPSSKGLTLAGNISGSSLTTSGNINGAIITGTQVRGAVFNDIADLLEIDEDIEVEYGKAYKRNKKYKVELTSKYGDIPLGIASDTYGFLLGEKKGKKQIPIAIGGWALAYIDKVYPFGTPLVATKNGYLTKAKNKTKEYKIIAIFDRVEEKEFWNGIEVDGRHWVKVK